MDLSKNKIIEQSDGTYINIGTVKSCLFVRMSSFLLRRLQQYPLLYFAVEEALECAKTGYYGIGVMAFAQLLNIFNEKTPDSRHRVGHKLLEFRPTKEAFDSIVAEFKRAAAERQQLERAKYENPDMYDREISLEWWQFMRTLHDLPNAPEAN